MWRRYFNLIKNIKNWFLYFLAKNNPEKLYKFVGKNGIEFWVTKEIMPIFKEIYMENLYEVDFITQKIHTKSPVVVDIGANVGYAATFLLSHFPEAQVISFEPLPSNFELLSENQKLNSHKNWQVVQMAVAKDEGELILFYQKSKKFTPIASVWKDFERENTENMSIKTLGLADIFVKFAITKIDLLKIDCEGAEYDILYHCPQEILQKIQLIAMETHQGKSDVENQQAMVVFLEKNGFMVHTQGAMLWAWR